MKRTGRRGSLDNNGDCLPAPPAAKKLRRPAAPSQPSLDQVRLCQDVYDALRASKTDDGKGICDCFLRAPSRRNAPDYYKIVANPIDLMRIQQKLKTEEYESLDQLAADIQLLTDNAKQYYRPLSAEFKAAYDLWDVFQEIKGKAENGVEILQADTIFHSHEPSPTPSTRSLRSNSPSRSVRSKDTSPARFSVSGTDPVDQSVLEELLVRVIELADENGRILSPPFRLLPSKVEYPEYYVTIKDPIDLKMIAGKIKSGEYRCLNDLEKDLILMCRNAKTFNEPGSMINRDSTVLRKFIALKKIELLETAISPVEKTNWYPDYYDEIKNPMSLFLINKKLKRNEYKNIGEMLEDLNLMCDNAKSYNIEGSEIFANACRLQVLGNRKAKELVPSLDMKSWPTDLPSGIDLYEPLPNANTSTPVLSKQKKAGDGVKGRPGRKTMDELMSRYRAKLMQVFDVVWNYREGNNDRWVAQAFVEKPNARLYPEYYQFIPEPIDLSTIRANIEADKYENTTQLKQDFELLFNNARHFNESGSQIYMDAYTLENQMKTGIKSLGPMILESPKLLKEKYGWRALFSWSKTRTTGPMNKEGAPGGARDGSPASKTARGSPATPTTGSGGTEKGVRKISAQWLIANTAEQKKMFDLFNSINNYMDSKGRRLSAIFQKLPSRADYPDYYDVIKKPIDITKISNRLNAGNYESFDAICQDFHLMFDNACRYNEPESGIYKDALCLQKVLLQRKFDLKGTETGIPNVQAAVQEMLTHLFVTVHTHEDEEGRCYSDSLAELPELHGKEMNLLALDKIKRNLDKVFEDSVELQQFFIKTRDELCKRGEYFLSPALSFTERHLLGEIERQRKEKQPIEQQEDAARPEDPKMSPSKKRDGEIDLSCIEANGSKYSVGEFVYVRSNEENEEPHIMKIERIWRDDAVNEEFISGNWYYRPHQTYHLATRKFLEKEVFISQIHDKTVKNRLMGKCYVMFIKDYFKYRPKGFEAKDVYVCESRYLGRILHFRKLKVWPFDSEGGFEVELEEREEPLAPSRVPSVFVSSGAGISSSTELSGIKAKEEIQHTAAAVDDGSEVEDQQEAEDYSILEKGRQEVVLEKGEDGCDYYEQLCFNSLWLKLGDGVLTRSEGILPDILRVDKLWRTPDGDSYLSGPSFVRPHEIEHEPSRMFYKREVFGTECKADRVLKVENVIRRCSILSWKEYILYRPTEVNEEDVFLVISKVKAGGFLGAKHELFVPVKVEETGVASAAVCGESERNSREEPDICQQGTLEDTVGSPPPAGAYMSEANSRKIKTLKTYKLSQKVLDDELYYFRKPISPEKEPSPFLARTKTSADSDVLSTGDCNESGLDLDPADMSGKDMKTWLASQPKLNSRSKSGYILFSAEIRKKIMIDNPNAAFGEISKLVGEEWKKRSDEEKKRFEARAQLIAEERARADVAAGPPAGARPQPGQMVIYCCKWKDCTYQFETVEQLWEHITTAHTSQIVEGEGSQYVCLWMTCAKYKKDGKPFPSAPRLHRHIKEKHMRSAVKCIFPNQKGKNYVPLVKPEATPPPASTPAPQQAQFPAAVQYTQAAQQPPGSVAMVAPGGQQVYYQQYGQQQVLVDAHGQVIQQATVQQATGVPGQQQVYQVQIGQQPSTSTQQQVVVAGGQQVVVQQAGQVQPQQAPAPYTQDPGKTIVQASKPAEPVFVAPPASQRIQRVLHSEAYLRYIESMHANPRQQTVSKWDRALGASASNSQLPSSSEKKLTTDWLGKGKPTNKEELVKTLWNLRDRMLKDALGISNLMEEFPE